MKKVIVVIGATGHLGGKIINSLLSKGAEVKALVRLETDVLKINALESKGVVVVKVDMTNKVSIVSHLNGVTCIVSALSGLKETIIDTQTIILEAAVEAKVPRFIPSDYSIDFTSLRVGQNRNLDLRRTFHERLNNASIKSTSIFNGAFMELLTTDMPLILVRQKKILCWGNSNQPLEFTTTFNIAEYTAEVALDDEAPRYLRIAGDRLTCNEFVTLLKNLTNKNYKLFRPGGIGLFNVIIKLTKFFSPSAKELYPAWQGMQYMRDMMEGRIVFQKYDNDRYAALKWKRVKDFLIEEKIELK